MKKYFKTQSIEALILNSEDPKNKMIRSIGAFGIIAMGIGGIIGAGLFIRTPIAASYAGPAVTLSYIIAALGCMFAGLCYSEFASIAPISGSAYSYSYISLGEVVAWIIGWALILEYALTAVNILMLTATTVAVAWSEYFNALIGDIIPYQYCHSPFSSAILPNGTVIRGFINIPAVLIVFIITLIIIRGIKTSITFTVVTVAIKLAIIFLFIFIGWQFIKPSHFHPYLLKAIDTTTPWSRYGWGGILAGASAVFYAFVGFDAVSATAQETKNPKVIVPFGILGSLVAVTIIYIIFSHVLIGVATLNDFVTGVGKEATISFVIGKYMAQYVWLKPLVTVAILAGFTSVILVWLIGQSRILYGMSRDNLLPKLFSDLHPKYATPYKANWVLFVLVAIFSGVIPLNKAGDLASFGTLLAFIIVCIGVIILRKTKPNLERRFRTPLVPFVPIMGIIVCLFMLIGLGLVTFLVSLAWFAIGLIIYFTYSVKHSLLHK